MASSSSEKTPSGRKNRYLSGPQPGHPGSLETETCIGTLTGHRCARSSVRKQPRSSIFDKASVTPYLFCGVSPHKSSHTRGRGLRHPSADDPQEAEAPHSRRKMTFVNTRICEDNGGPMRSAAARKLMPVRQNSPQTEEGQNSPRSKPIKGKSPWDEVPFNKRCRHLGEKRRGGSVQNSLFPVPKSKIKLISCLAKTAIFSKMPLHFELCILLT
ncbi:hypothetical protein NQ315_014489 [Exocentrus adspersus]|uniref:Uncharacterized protein n=1 Tax=Exocentrus adspersus TaxID=1586481 RepID=A0AAV8VFH5_9CUCU|nr:hypothetical protein NQ315_014489 [Exocentrus adspersus]